MKFFFYKILVLLEIIKESFSYNDSIPFNWTKTAQYCYEEDFVLSNNYRPFVNDIYPMKGCTSDERNKNYATNFGINNITLQPKLDFFIPNNSYPPLDLDPATSMTFRLNFPCSLHQLIFDDKNEYSYRIYFGRSDDYLEIPRLSKRTGNPIEFDGKKAILNARVKYYKNELQDNKKGNVVVNFTSKDFDFYEYEGEELKVTFDRYELDLRLSNLFNYNERIITDMSYCQNSTDYYALLIRVYDLPRIKVQGLFQYKGVLFKTKDNSEIYSNVYTLDTRFIFFQNISMFYNQRINVTDKGDEPTGEDSGFWINTPCNKPQMATIMVDYFFFETIHKMQTVGYEFSDRFQLRIHTPYYRKTLTSSYSLFRSQWNETYEKPRVFIHPISKYKEHCSINTCSKFDYDEWSTSPEFTQYIIDIKNEIVENEIRINFTELEKIYAADGFNRSKLSINVNNTMTPHITQAINGLWAELYDTVTNDWVMKTKTTMDEVNGYSGDYEADPFRNFYLTCEIPDNLTSDDIEFVLKKYGLLQTAHLWFRLDVFNKGITKMYPPRFNVVFKFPPHISLRKDTFGYTYQYYKVPGDEKDNWHWMLKDMRKDGLEDGVITNTTFDYIRNMINVSELHPNYPNGDDTMFYTQSYEYLCTENSGVKKNCVNLEIKRQFLYYFYDLYIDLYLARTEPIEITVYQIRYVPYHSKDQINRGLHRWNPHHAGWKIPSDAIFKDTSFNTEYYKYYFESSMDNYFYKPQYSDSYINKRGPTYVDSYNGPDCVFGFAGGSTLRNKSCEFWSGIIPDKPFTNYARDIYEEFIAYRSLNDDTFTIDLSIDRRPEYLKFSVLDPYPGKFTSICFEVFYWINPIRGEEDGEPKCTEFYETPEVCKIKGASENFKPIYNVHEYPKEFFVRIKLPDGFTVNSTVVGTVRPCFWASRGYSNFTLYSLQDYLCYYNETYIFAFESLGQLGFFPNSGLYDIIMQIDGIYINENSSLIKKETGYLKFGFYESTFFHDEYPKNDEPLFYNKNVSVEIVKSNETNDQISNLSVRVKANDWFTIDNFFRLDFSEIFENVTMTTLCYNGNCSEELMNDLKKVNGFSYNTEIFNTYWNYMNLPKGNEVGYSYIIKPYIFYYNDHPEPANYSLIKENEVMIFEINFIVKNYRSFKPLSFNFYMSNYTYKLVFQHEILSINNTEPIYFTNLTLNTTSLYTYDRAIYTINFLVNITAIYDNDYITFKTSWRTSFNNNTESDENGYYINKFNLDKNYTNNGIKNITILANYLINPDTLEEQYIKDFTLHDKEGYILSVNKEIIPIKMEHIISFKYTEVSTVSSESGYNLFNITIDLVPEIMIRQEDTLSIKFSSAIPLGKLSESNIVAIKGLNITDENFTFEINVTNNELILRNGFKDIGQNLTVLEDENAKSIAAQEIIFSLTNVPIKQNYKIMEKLFSMEAKIINNEGIITQENNLVSTIHFNCGYRCKTCEKDNVEFCLSCHDEYPLLYKDVKECHKSCLNESFIILKDEEENLVCELCEQPCLTCEGNITNCTNCIQPYFLEENKCVLNCSEGYSPDNILRSCYEIVNINLTSIEEKIVYVNVSVPKPNYIYIEKNICEKNETDE